MKMQLIFADIVGVLACWSALAQSGVAPDHRLEAGANIQLEAHLTFTLFTPISSKRPSTNFVGQTPVNGMLNWSFGKGKYEGQVANASWKFETSLPAAERP